MSDSLAQLEHHFSELLAEHGQQSHPPVHLWQPDQRGEIDIRIDADGAWYHDGQPIRRQALCNLFATILRCDEGEYFLVTPIEQLRIRVDEEPFVAIDLDVRGVGRQTDLLFRTNVGDLVLADADHPLVQRAGKPCVLVRHGLHARLARSVYYRLAEHAYEVAAAIHLPATYAVSSSGCEFRLD